MKNDTTLLNFIKLFNRHSPSLVESIVNGYNVIFEETKVEDRTKNVDDKIIAKYGNDDSIYVTFTNIAKVGINPRSTYNTPNGVYTYNVHDCVDIHPPFPFKGEEEASYAKILKYTGNKLISSDTYSESDLQKDYQKLSSYAKEKNLLSRLADLSDCEGNATVQSPLGYLWFITHTFKRNPNEWNKLFREVLGYDGVRDKNTDPEQAVIHENEPTQTVFFNKLALTEIETILNLTHRQIEIKELNRKGKGNLADKLTERYEQTTSSIHKLNDSNVMRRFLASTNDIQYEMLTKMSTKQRTEVFTSEPLKKVVDSLIFSVPVSIKYIPEKIFSDVFTTHKNAFDKLIKNKPDECFGNIPDGCKDYYTKNLTSEQLAYAFSKDPRIIVNINKNDQVPMLSKYKQAFLTGFDNMEVVDFVYQLRHLFDTNPKVYSYMTISMPSFLDKYENYIKKWN